MPSGSAEQRRVDEAPEDDLAALPAGSRAASSRRRAPGGVVNAVYERAPDLVRAPAGRWGSTGSPVASFVPARRKLRVSRLEHLALDALTRREVAVRARARCVSPGVVHEHQRVPDERHVADERTRARAGARRRASPADEARALRAGARAPRASRRPSVGARRYERSVHAI